MPEPRLPQNSSSSTGTASAAAPTRLRPIWRKAWAKVAGLAVMRAEVFWWKTHGGRCGSRRPAAIWWSMSAKLAGSAGYGQHRHSLRTVRRNASSRDRKSGGAGKGGSVRVDLGGRRSIKKKNKKKEIQA